MDVFEAIFQRRSCRSFKELPFDQELLQQILEAGIWAPSPKNAQPWEFLIITDREIRQKIYHHAEECRKELLARSGWQWMSKYSVDFLKTVPVIVAVIGDPDKTGADRFLKEGGLGYHHACAAAIQNMLLAAHALGLASLWFSLFEPQALRDILQIEAGKSPIALVCLGYPKGSAQSPGRKDRERVIRFLR